MLLRGVIEASFGGVPMVVFERSGEFLCRGDVCGFTGQGMKCEGGGNKTCIVIGSAFMARAAGAVAVQQSIVFPEQVNAFGEGPCCGIGPCLVAKYQRRFG